MDNILIDEARTPLIISGQPEQAADLYAKFAKLAKIMESGKKPEGMDPRMKKDFEADYDFEFEEKHKTVSVTEKGVAKAEKFLGIAHLYRAENGPLVNHLQQALKAESLYRRDVDYAVIDDEVKIIDEFTGRILEGRRWSEGLHQAVEAKEGVRVQEENQTLATITLQNYFRLYKKLAGMTGTALTEATEFMKIYKLPVVEVPTNQPMVRADRNDQVYKTKEGKWSAVAREIVERHAAGQPVLVGTISVEVSELLSTRLKSARRAAHRPQRQARVRREGRRRRGRGRPARRRHHRHEHGRPRRGHQAGRQPRAPHSARARQARPAPRRSGLRRDVPRPCSPRSRGASPSRVTRSSSAGGLFIVGTERHESRRIDNQLRGRAGRQGDPGESRFFLCAEDDLVRLFAGDRIYQILDRLGTVDEDGNEEPIEAGMLSKQIEKAQKKVEEQNFLIRKRVLEYDDVMNEQRRIVYEYRDEVLEGNDMGGPAREEIGSVIEPPRRRVHRPATTSRNGTSTGSSPRWRTSSRSDLGRGRPRSADRPTASCSSRCSPTDAMKLYDQRETELGEELMRALERYLLLQIIDQTLARAPLRHGLPARGHPPARVRPDRADRRLQERGVHALHRPDEHDLVGLRAHDLQRRGRGRGAQRRRARRSATRRPARAPAPAASPTPGGVGTEQPSALAAAAAAGGAGAAAGYADDEEYVEAMPVVEQRASTSTSRSGATTRAGAARARSSRSATARSAEPLHDRRRGDRPQIRELPARP